MQFKVLALAFTALSGFVNAQQVEFSAGILTNAIDAIADISAETNEIASSIDLRRPFTIFTAAPRVILNFKDIATTVASKILMLGNIQMTEDFPRDGQNQVCEAFSNFVRIHQALLNTIIGKSSLFSRTPFIAPLTAVLRVLEVGVDKLAFSIIGLVPTCREGAEKDKMALDATFDEAISKLSF
ncbi:hypothetical protein ACHAQA_005107 [Verticillium albo-atrum]